MPSSTVSFLIVKKAFLFYCIDSRFSVPLPFFSQVCVEMAHWVYHTLRKKTVAGVSASYQLNSLF